MSVMMTDYPKDTLDCGQLADTLDTGYMHRLDAPIFLGKQSGFGANIDFVAHMGGTGRISDRPRYGNLPESLSKGAAKDTCR